MKLLFSVFDLFPKLLIMFAEITEFNWLELWKSVTQPVATQIASRNPRLDSRPQTAPAETTVASPVATRNQTMMNRDLHCDSQPAVATRNLRLRLEISVATRDHRLHAHCWAFTVTGPIYWAQRFELWTVLLMDLYVFATWADWESGLLYYWTAYVIGPGIVGLRQLDPHMLCLICLRAYMFAMTIRDYYIRAIYEPDLYNNHARTWLTNY